MRRIFRLAARLYPTWWRQRYASEFEALLEDVDPGWREFFDVIHGALAMQVTTLGTISVVCALAGAIVGGVIAARTPESFGSSATVCLRAQTSQELRASLGKALHASGGINRATTVTLLGGNSSQNILRLTYLDRDPAQAQRVAEKLIAAIATEIGAPAASTGGLDAPVFVTFHIKPDSRMTVASGAGVGLIVGGMVFLLLRSRRRLASAA